MPEALPEFSDQHRAQARAFVVEAVTLAVLSPLCQPIAKARIAEVMPVLCKDAGGAFGALRNAADHWAHGGQWLPVQNALMRLLAERHDSAAKRLGLSVADYREVVE